VVGGVGGGGSGGGDERQKPENWPTEDAGSVPRVAAGDPGPHQDLNRDLKE